MDIEKNIEAERQELNLLISKGVTFDLQRTIYVRRKGIFGILKKRVKQAENTKYTIKEPTLSVLDRISAEQIDLTIDENIMSSEKGVQQAKKMVLEHGRRMARIIAIAVLGTDALQTILGSGGVKYVYDFKRLDQLTEILFMNLKPSKLYQLAFMVNTMSNLGDFTNSIRLMSASRTTMPIRIEESKEG